MGAVHRHIAQLTSPSVSPAPSWWLQPSSSVKAGARGKLLASERGIVSKDTMPDVPLSLPAGEDSR